MTLWQQVVGALAGVVILTGISASWAGGVVPLPDNLEIIAPDPTIPAELASFSGKWHGWWDGNILEHILVVEEIRLSYAIVVYAVGVARMWNIHEPRWFRVRGRFEKKELKLEFPGQITVTYRMNRDGTLAGTYEGPGVFSRVRLQKK